MNGKTMPLSSLRSNTVADVHRSLPSRLRGQVRRKSTERSGARQVSGESKCGPRGPYSAGVEDGDLAGDQEPLAWEHQRYRNLVAAVIAQATYDFREIYRSAMGHYSGKSKVYRDRAGEFALGAAFRSRAGRWFSESSRKPFGFEWCCIVLDLPKERVMKGLLDPSRRNGDGRRDRIFTEKQA